MEIGLVIANNYPLDREVRTKRVSKTLDDNDHSVTVFGYNSRSDAARGTIQGEFLPTTDRLEYANVLRFSWLVSVPVLSFLTRPLPFNPLWLAWMIIGFAREDVDLVVACDIRAGPTAIVAAKLLGIPVIVDVRENFPEYAKLLSTGSLVDRIQHNELIVRRLEEFVFRQADEVWVVTEERRDSLDVRLRNQANITVVKNVPSLAESQQDTSRAVEPIGSTRSGFTFVYVGVINDYRGLDPIIEALGHVESHDGIHVIIAGEGPHRPALERLATRLGVQDSVTFTGWIDSEEVPAFLNSGDVGLIPHDVNAFTNTTLPNKLFDCMLQGLPVLATDMAPVSRIVRETGCGRIIPRNAEPEDITSIMTDMMQTDSLLEMGENGRRAVETRYNWEVESKTVLESVERVSRGP